MNHCVCSFDSDACKMHLLALSAQDHFLSLAILSQRSEILQLDTPIKVERCLIVSPINDSSL